MYVYIVEYFDDPVKVFGSRIGAQKWLAEQGFSYCTIYDNGYEQWGNDNNYIYLIRKEVEE